MPLSIKLSKRFITGIILFVISLFVFGFIAHEIVRENDARLDEMVFDFVGRHTTPETIRLMRGLTFFGSHKFLIPAHLVILFILLVRRHWQDAIVTTFMALGGLLSMIALKNYFHRDRPEIKLVEVTRSFSFPSGHSLSSFVLVAVLIYLLWENRWPKHRKVVVFVVLLLFSICVGVSRIVLRVHYASDVMAGFCAGISLVVFSLWVNKFLIKRFVVNNPRRREEQQ